MSAEDDDSRPYKVVVNEEEQHSIWFAEASAPAGWRETGKVGPKAECLRYIREVWVDLRPASVRRALEDKSPSLD